MDLARVLVDSLRLLYDKPLVFVPRLITTAIYSVVMLYLMKIALSVNEAVEVSDPAALRAIGVRLGVLALSIPFVYFIDIISYAMYPRIVADHQAGRKIDLKGALADSLLAWRIIIILGLALFAFAFVAAVMVFPGYYIFLSTGSLLLFIPSLLLALAAVIAFAIVMFFVVPSAILDGHGVIESFRQSMELGLKNKVDLLKINLLFVLLLALTMVMGANMDFGTVASVVSAGIFILVRLLEALVYTYLSVTNPMAYLAVRVNKSGAK
jgi:hypothetical protein